MPAALVNRLKYLLERMVLRGAHYRLLVIIALIGLLSVLAGAVVHVTRAGVDGGFPAAVWWAFLRLSDPGYLGDDQGTLLRVVSTLLTVLGYVVFLGALVAIMTQWLNQRMRDLEAGLTPIAQRDHVLIIGWSNRTATIVRELVMSGARVRRFLQLRGARNLRIAILADEVTTELGIELRDRLGRHWNARQVVLRTGSPLRLEHLRRVDLPHAAAMILPAADLGHAGPAHADTRTVKTLLSIANHPELGPGARLPLAVAEVLDSRHVEIARRAYSGPVEILASDAIIGRLIAQNVRNPGLSHVYGELLTHDRGSEIYVRDAAPLAGATFGELASRFEQAVVLGVVRPEDGSFVPLLNPKPGMRLQPGDRIVLAAGSFAATEPNGPRPARASAPQAGIRVALRRPRRVLLLGWNHKLPALLKEFDSHEHDEFEIDVVSTVPVRARTAQLEAHGVAPRRLRLRQVEGDYATAALLERVDVPSYDSIVLLGSTRFEADEDADARTIMGYLLLRDLLPAEGGPHVLIELLDPGNVTLFRQRRGEVIESPAVLSHMLAQVALRRELRAVFDELFGPGGAEIVFRPAAEYALVGDTAFRDVEAAASARGEIALGMRIGGAGRGGGGVTLNPPKEQRWTLGEGDGVVALTTY